MIKLHIVTLAWLAVVLPAALSQPNVAERKDLFDKLEAEYRTAVDNLKTTLAIIRNGVKNEGDGEGEGEGEGVSDSDFDDSDIIRTNYDADPWTRSHGSDFLGRIIDFVQDVIAWTKFDK